MQEFLKDMVQNRIFGKVLAYIYVIEFQKRGLPHLHSLWFLRDEDKFRNGDDIERVVGAELPDPDVDRELYDIILRNNIHGPCGHLKPNAPCMENGKCTKQFPKQFRDETDATGDGYPQYRCRDDSNENHIVRGVPVDNRFIVPYNAYLSKKYHAHVNCEIFFTVGGVKYIFKYIHKGHDCARVEIR